MNPFTQLRDELVKQIIGINHPFLSNAITAFIFLAFLLSLIYIGKLLLQDWKKEKEDKKKRIEREKNIIQSFKDKNKK